MRLISIAFFLGLLFLSSPFINSNRLTNVLNSINMIPKHGLCTEVKYIFFPWHLITIWQSARSLTFCNHSHVYMGMSLYRLSIANLTTFSPCQGAQKEGGGPNVFMREALNLVDFFVSNYLTQDVDLSTLEVSTSLLSTCRLLHAICFV